jgi:hypothetical protein
MTSAALPLTYPFASAFTIALARGALAAADLPYFPNIGSWSVARTLPPLVRSRIAPPIAQRVPELKSVGPWFESRRATFRRSGAELRRSLSMFLLAAR